MKKINIGNMPPQAILVKDAFKRIIPSDSGIGFNSYHSIGSASTDYNECQNNDLKFEILSQADFLREFDVNAHKINSIKYLPNLITKDDKSGKISAKQKSRIAVGFQKRIWTKRVATLTGNNINLRITNSTKTNKEEYLLNEFRSGWENKNIENAIFEAICSDGMVGDAAIGFYLKDGKMGWRPFSFDKGDILYPQYDPMTGTLAVFGRAYSQKDWNGNTINDYLDVWDDTHYCRYKLSRTGVKGILNSIKETIGYGGWELDIEPIPHGFNRIPIAYTRYGAPYWADSQPNIENYELSLSQLAENNGVYALRILYALGSDMEVTASLDGTPMRIDSTDPNAKLGFLEPSDASRSFELQFNKLEQHIMRASFASETPEMKSGSDMSSLTVRMLMMDSYQKALLDSQHYQPFIDDIVEIFKYGYSIEIEKPSDYTNFHIKGEIFPYIFMSETEQVSNIVQLRAAGGLSKQTTSELAYELGYAVVSESERIAKEERDELIGIQPQPNIVVENNEI